MFCCLRGLKRESSLITHYFERIQVANGQSDEKVCNERTAYFRFMCQFCKDSIEV